MRVSSLFRRPRPAPPTPPRAGEGRPSADSPSLGHPPPPPPPRPHDPTRDHDYDNMVEEIDYQTEKPPMKTPFYKTRRFWIIAVAVTAGLLAIFIPLIIFVFFPLIAQSIVNNSGLDVQVANLTSPKESGFQLGMKAALTRTGPFPGDLEFTKPVTVKWQDKELGVMVLPSVAVAGGSGQLETATDFQISDPAAFAEFTKEMVAKDEFVWHLSSEAIIKAMGMTAKNLKVEKDVSLKGLNGLQNVTITKFDLPGDDPAGGIKLLLGTNIQNPSPFGIQLGAVALDVGFKDTFIGSVSTPNLLLAPGDNSVELTGRLLPHNNTSELQQLSEMFSSFVSGRRSNAYAKATSALPDGVHSVSWLSAGLAGLQMQVGLQSPQPLEIIRNISIDTLALGFNPQSPYAPITSTDTVRAIIQVPFGFSLNIEQVRQSINIELPGFGPLASLTSDWARAQKNLTTGEVMLSIPNAPMQVVPGKEALFDEFVANLTLFSESVITLAGNATGQASTPIGLVTLTDLPFRSNVTLRGLRGLRDPPPVINSIDVVGGQKDGLQLAVSTSLFNPSNIHVSMGGDVSTLLDFKQVQLGSVILPNLTLAIGANQVNARGIFDPNRDPAGTELLEKFLVGENNTVAIEGTKDSTQIPPLNKGLAQVKAEAVMPGLTTKLVQQAKVVILPDTPQTSVAQTLVNISNTFTADLQLNSIQAVVTQFGQPVGTLDVADQQIVIKGKSTQSTPGLPLKMNLEPTAIIVLLRGNAVDKGLNVAPLDALLKLGGYEIGDAKGKRRRRRRSVSRRALMRRGVFDGFNISEFVLKAMAQLRVDMDMKAKIQVGEYQTSIHYQQSAVDARTDESVLRLIPIVGNPIVQTIVNNAVFGLTKVIIQEPSNQGFKTRLVGSLTNAGPLDAKIEFAAPIEIKWNGRVIAKITQMPALLTKADIQGGNFDVVATAEVVDAEGLEKFSEELIHKEGFTWDLSCGNLAVTALGFTFTGITMTKQVSLKGMNEFKSGIKVVKFDLPGDDPAGGIKSAIVTSLQNPSNVGLLAQSAGFEASFKNIKVAELAALNQLIDSEAEVNLALQGRLLPQTTEEGLKAASELFNNFIHGIDTPLDVTGGDVLGGGGKVDWLSAAFRTLKLNLVLPGAKGLQLLPAITIKQFALAFTKETAYSPLISSDNVEAELKSPFPITLNPKQTKGDFTIVNNGVDTAKLSLPFSPVQSDVKPGGGIIHIKIPQVNLPVLDKGSFNGYLSDITHLATKQFGMKGTVDAVTGSGVGDLTLTGIEINVQSALAGLQGLKGKQPRVVGLDIDLGGVFSGNLGLKVVLNNPSQISAQLGDVVLDAFYEGTKIGVVDIKGLTLVPGDNTVPTQLHLLLGEALPKILAMLFKALTQAVVVEVKGNDKSTEIESLRETFAKVDLPVLMPPLPELLPGSSLGLFKNMLATSFPQQAGNLVNDTLGKLPSILPSVPLPSVPLPAVSNLPIPTKLPDLPIPSKLPDLPNILPIPGKKPENGPGNDGNGKDNGNSGKPDNKPSNPVEEVKKKAEDAINQIGQLFGGGR
ncbi:uncharacterized protein VTP21DRAFT_6640 [Calcarisporiella thermophila]|uniref:uncharacterized protein n=1 Tax=Calcarisporiella thermophila TaxID=911321 RepID=UPI0037442656